MKSSEKLANITRLNDKRTSLMKLRLGVYVCKDCVAIARVAGYRISDVWANQFGYICDACNGRTGPMYRLILSQDDHNGDTGTYSR